MVTKLIFFIVFFSLSKSKTPGNIENSERESAIFNYGTMFSAFLGGEGESKTIDIDANSDISKGIFSCQIMKKNNLDGIVEIHFNNEVITLNSETFKKTFYNISLNNYTVDIYAVDEGGVEIQFIIEVPKSEIQYINTNGFNQEINKTYIYFEFNNNSDIESIVNLILKGNKDENSFYLLNGKLSSDFLYFTENCLVNFGNSYPIQINNGETDFLFIKFHKDDIFTYNFTLFNFNKIKSYDNTSLNILPEEKYKIFEYNNNPIRENESSIFFNFAHKNYPDLYIYDDNSKIFFSNEQSPIDYIIQKIDEEKHYYDNFNLQEKKKYYILFYNSKSKSYSNKFQIHNPGEIRELKNEESYFQIIEIFKDKTSYFYNIPSSTVERSILIDFSFYYTKTDDELKVFYWNSNEEESKEITLVNHPNSILLSPNLEYNFKVTLTTTKTSGSLILSYFIYKGYNSIIDLDKIKTLNFPFISEEYSLKFFLDISMKSNERIKFALTKHESISFKDDSIYRGKEYNDFEDAKKDTSDSFIEESNLIIDENNIISFEKKNENAKGALIKLNLIGNNQDFYNIFPHFSFKKFSDIKRLNQNFNLSVAPYEELPYSLEKEDFNETYNIVLIFSNKEKYIEFNPVYHGFKEQIIYLIHKNEIENTINFTVKNEEKNETFKFQSLFFEDDTEKIIYLYSESKKNLSGRKISLIKNKDYYIIGAFKKYESSIYTVLEGNLKGLKIYYQLNSISSLYDISSDKNEYKNPYLPLNKYDFIYIPNVPEDREITLNYYNNVNTNEKILFKKGESFSFNYEKDTINYYNYDENSDILKSQFTFKYIFAAQNNDDNQIPYLIINKKEYKVSNTYSIDKSDALSESITVSSKAGKGLINFVIALDINSYDQIFEESELRTFNKNYNLFVFPKNKYNDFIQIYIENKGNKEREICYSENNNNREYIFKENMHCKIINFNESIILNIENPYLKQEIKDDIDYYYLFSIDEIFNLTYDFRFFNITDLTYENQYSFSLDEGKHKIFKYKIQGLNYLIFNLEQQEQSNSEIFFYKKFGKIINNRKFINYDDYTTKNYYYTDLNNGVFKNSDYIYLIVKSGKKSENKLTVLSSGINKLSSFNQFNFNFCLNKGTYKFQFEFNSYKFDRFYYNAKISDPNKIKNKLTLSHEKQEINSNEYEKYDLDKDCIYTINLEINVLSEEEDLTNKINFRIGNELQEIKYIINDNDKIQLSDKKSELYFYQDISGKKKGDKIYYRIELEEVENYKLYYKTYNTKDKDIIRRSLPKIGDKELEKINENNFNYFFNNNDNNISVVVLFSSNNSNNGILGIKGEFFEKYLNETLMKYFYPEEKETYYINLGSFNHYKYLTILTKDKDFISFSGNNNNIQNIDNKIYIISESCIEPKKNITISLENKEKNETKYFESFFSGNDTKINIYNVESNLDIKNYGFAIEKAYNSNYLFLNISESKNAYFIARDLISNGTLYYQSLKEINSINQIIKINKSENLYLEPKEKNFNSLLLKGESNVFSLFSLTFIERLKSDDSINLDYGINYPLILEKNKESKYKINDNINSSFAIKFTLVENSNEEISAEIIFNGEKIILNKDKLTHEKSSVTLNNTEITLNSNFLSVIFIKIGIPKDKVKTVSTTDENKEESLSNKYTIFKNEETYSLILNLTNKKSGENKICYEEDYDSLNYISNPLNCIKLKENESISIIINSNKFINKIIRRLQQENTKELFTIIYAEDPENIKYIYKKQNPSEKDERHFPIWIIVLIVIGVLILIILIVLLIKRHKLNDNENTNKKIEELNYI